MILIDADRLLADLKEENVVPICIQNLTKKNKQIIRFENMICEQPTAYDVIRLWSIWKRLGMAIQLQCV